MERDREGYKKTPHAFYSKSCLSILNSGGRAKRTLLSEGKNYYSTLSRLVLFHSSLSARGLRSRVTHETGQKFIRLLCCSFDGGEGEVIKGTKG